jgi:CheY-like chemotaxis protein
MKVLLVEDDLIVQRVHQLMLVKLGCQVDIASNGNEALKKVDESHYEVVFVDIGLPDISGFDLIQQLRKDYLCMKDVPIFALTGYAGVKENQACMAAGATDVAHKPIISSTLRELLERHKVAVSE